MPAAFLTLAAGLMSLLWGLAPPGVIGTGQLSLAPWLVPVATAAAVLAGAFALGWLRLGMGPVCLAAASLTLPPLVLCMAGAQRIGLPPTGLGTTLPVLTPRPAVLVMSGPRLHQPVIAASPEGMEAQVRRAPLWRLLSRRFDLRPVDHLTPAAMSGASILLLVQPRALAPEELVALDAWVRSGGRAVMLADPDLRWADDRPLGDPSRAPHASLLAPLFSHWRISLGFPKSTQAGVERRMLADGTLLQLAGAGVLRATGAHCRRSADGFMLDCRIGLGSALIVADADFVHDGLWTMAPDSPENGRFWTSDAVCFVADALKPGAGAWTGARWWLRQADGLSAALRPALFILLLCMAGQAVAHRKVRTNMKHVNPVPS